MPIVTFWNSAREQTGQTISATCVATATAIEHNLKSIVISTSLNDDTLKNCFWYEKPRKMAGLFGTNTNFVAQSGVEGLDRIVRSNKMSPDIVKDYTKVVLKDRLEILLGLKGTQEQYELLSKQYPEIVLLASRYYDMVIVDLDKRMNPLVRNEILKNSDVIVQVVSQRPYTIKENIEYIEKNTQINARKIILAIGKYDENLKYNMKNISRTILKQRDFINTIPYNELLFEAVQEGNMVDLILNLLRLKGKDKNTLFLSETKRLIQDIKMKIEECK